MKKRKKSSRHALNPKLPGRYGRMTAEQLDRETEIFDQEFVADSAHPLGPVQRAQEHRARRRGRPRVGKGARRVLVTIEGQLLKATDKYAKRHGLSRAALIARGLQSVIGKAS
jgi:hypothetical protein